MYCTGLSWFRVQTKTTATTAKNCQAPFALNRLPPLAISPLRILESYKLLLLQPENTKTYNKKKTPPVNSHLECVFTKMVRSGVRMDLLTPWLCTKELRPGHIVQSVSLA